MKVLTGLLEHLSSSMVLLSVESAANITSGGASTDNILKTCFPLKKRRKARQSTEGDKQIQG